jgi:hypothetical protein
MAEARGFTAITVNRIGSLESNKRKGERAMIALKSEKAKSSSKGELF